MPSKVIGIVSYLPDDKGVREARFCKLKELICRCNYLFGLPIYILTQNYSDSERSDLKLFPNVSLSDNYPRLGIVVARNFLRDWFLDSEYDCEIMLDDDCEVSGSLRSAKDYLSYIDDNEGCFIEFNGSLLKLFAIYKYPFSEVSFGGPNPEDGGAFEDTIFVARLEKMHPELRRRAPKGSLVENSKSCDDPNSTWQCGQNLKDMLANTRKIINDIC